METVCDGIAYLLTDDGRFNPNDDGRVGLRYDRRFDIGNNCWFDNQDNPRLESNINGLFGVQESSLKKASSQEIWPRRGDRAMTEGSMVEKFAVNELANLRNELMQS